jgi:hypothetical protein
VLGPDAPDFGGKARATMIFAVVNRCCPFGEAGRHRVARRVEVGRVGSIPESMIPILTPWPAVSSNGPQIVGAPICCGDEATRGAYVAVGRTSRTPGSLRRSAACAAGSVRE